MNAKANKNTRYKPEELSSNSLEELNKLRDKGEIGNRGYAAGLTKLAKQYPQLNKKVNEYETIFDYAVCHQCSRFYLLFE